MDKPVNVTISSRRRWHHTDVPLAAGATYRFTVPQGQSWWDWYIRYGPEGGVTGWIQEKFKGTLRFKGAGGRKAEYLTLIGAIGESLEHAFVIGAGPREFTAPVSGELVCFANDVAGFYWNNWGSMTLTVERIGPSQA